VDEMKKDKYFFEYPDFNNVKEMMYYLVNKYPEHNAFIVKNKIDKEVTYRKITFKNLLEDVNNFGTGLYDLGLKDKRIAIISKNRYEWALSFIAVLLGNMVVVPLDRGLTEIEIETSIERSKPDTIIFDNGMADTINKIKEKNTSIQEYICMEENEDFISMQTIMENGKKLREGGNKKFENAKIDSEKMCELCFTSGTSENSKIVMLSQRNIAFDICAMHATEDFRDTDVNLAFLPFHHTFGSTGILYILSYGAATAFPDGLRYISQNLKEYGVSVFIGVPLLVESMYKRIMNEVQKQGKTKVIKVARKVTNIAPFMKRKVFKQIIDQLGGKLRLIISGAAGLDKEVWLGFNEMGIKIIQGYGLTEAAPVVAAENFKYGKQGSIGFPMKGMEVKIIDKNEFGIGELAVKGANVMLGYYDNEEANKEVFKDGWLLTGDLAYIDKEGFIFITGRKKNVLVLKNGKNIYPEELENLVNKVPLVKECMVFGIPKDDDVVVTVKVQYDEEYAKEKYSGKDEKELEKIMWDEIKKINQTMPTYKYIKNLIFTNEDFIKTTTAKIKRYEEIKKIQNT
jgi:long-chain acyl-CoA synthetase